MTDERVYFSRIQYDTKNNVLRCFEPEVHAAAAAPHHPMSIE